MAKPVGEKDRRREDEIESSGGGRRDRGAQRQPDGLPNAFVRFDHEDLGGITGAGVNGPDELVGLAAEGPLQSMVIGIEQPKDDDQRVGQVVNHLVLHLQISRE